MKFKRCRVKLLPSVDLTSQVFWNILSKNIISKNIFYVLFILNFVTWVLLALRFSVLADEYKIQFKTNWEVKQFLVNNQQVEDNTQLKITIKSYFNYGILVLGIQILVLLCLLEVFRHFSQIKRKNSTMIQIMLKFLNVILIVENTLFSPFIKLIALVPILQISKFETSEARPQIAISFFILLFRSIGFFMFQKIFVLRYQNDLIPWSKPRHHAVVLDFIQHALLIIFICYFDINSLIITLFQVILFTISAAKVYLQIQKPYFYDKKLALIKLNMDIFKCSYFLSTIFVHIMSLDNKGFVIVFILSVLTVCSGVNIINLKYQDKLIVDILNNEIAETYQLEYGIYLLLSMMFKKCSNHFTNEYDGIIHSFEMNEEFCQFNTKGYKKSNQQTQVINFQSMAFTSKLEQNYQEHIKSQLEYLNQPNMDKKDEDEMVQFTGNNKNLENSLLFGTTTLQQLPSFGASNSLNEMSNNIIQENSNHTLAESFNYNSLNQQRLNELDQDKGNRENAIDKMRHREDNQIMDKILFLSDNLLAPFI